VPLYDEEFSPTDGLWDLVGEATQRAAGLGDGALVVISEGEAGFTETGHETPEAARAAAHECLAPGHEWRAAVAWRAGDVLLIEAQDAETDALAARFSVPVRRRRRWLRDEEVELGEPGFPSPVPPLREPSWTGATWTLRAGGRVVADLRVVGNRHDYLEARVSPREGLEAILPPSPYRQAPSGDWALHRPDGAAAVGELELQLNRDYAFWAWVEPPSHS
jgi:hypothetical protein